MSSTKEYFTESVELNNLGASHISNGNFSEAVKRLVSAHLAARESFRISPGHEVQQQEEDVSFFSKNYSLLDQIMLESLGHCKNDVIKPTFHESDLDYFVYARPIEIPQNLPYEHHEAPTIVFVSILFNLALAYHMEAMAISRKEDCAAQAALTRRALQLYRMAFRCHNNQPEAQGGYGKLAEPSNILLLALINNSGHTYHMLGENKDSSKCFEHLFAALSWLRLQACHRPTVTTTFGPFPSNIFDSFIHSTTTWLLRNSLCNATAPAA